MRDYRLAKSFLRSRNNLMRSTRIRLDNDLSWKIFKVKDEERCKKVIFFDFDRNYLPNKIVKSGRPQTIVQVNTFILSPINYTY